MQVQVATLIFRLKPTIYNTIYIYLLNIYVSCSCKVIPIHNLVYVHYLYVHLPLAVCEWQVITSSEYSRVKRVLVLTRYSRVLATRNHLPLANCESHESNVTRSDSQVPYAYYHISKRNVKP